MGRSKKFNRNNNQNHTCSHTNGPSNKTLNEIFALFEYLEKDVIAIQEKLGIEGYASQAPKSADEQKNANIAEMRIPLCPSHMNEFLKQLFSQSQPTPPPAYKP